MHAQSLSSPVWRLVSKRSNPLVAIRAAGGTPFYCIHPVAGDIASYDRLFDLIDPHQSLYGFQVTKDGMQRGAVRSIGSLTASYAKAIDEHCPAGPLMLGGYSAGAILALDTAQRLQRAGREIKLLVAMDGAPVNTGAELPPWHAAYLAGVVRNFPGWLSTRRAQDFTFGGLQERLTNRLVFRASGEARKQDAPARQHVATVARLVGRAGWQSDHVAFIRTLYDAIHDYIPTPYAGRVVVFEAQINRLFDQAQTSRIWRALAPQSDCIKVFAHHGNLIAGGPATTEVAAKLNEIFTELRAQKSTNSASGTV